MRATILRDFLAGTVAAEVLDQDVVGAFKSSGQDSFQLCMEDMREPFAVAAAHLVRLCDAVVEGRLDPEALRAIGFGMIASDHFEWDDSTKEGMRVSVALYAWASPEANYTLSIETAKKFKDQLLTGVDRFTREDLWRGGKRRSDRWEAGR